MSDELTAIANDLDSFVHDMREDGNDASALWLEQRASALRRLDFAMQQLCAVTALLTECRKFIAYAACYDDDVQSHKQRDDLVSRIDAFTVGRR